MRPDILIVGQGLAGTWLAGEFERAGISFELVDSGHAGAASRVAAGLINPITGRRLVKSWRVETLLPAARASYREMETLLQAKFWHELRIRRLFADERERRIAGDKYARGEFDPYVAVAPDDSGCWIEGAARVDVPRFLDATRRHWREAGRLREEACGELTRETARYDLVIDCRGRAGAFDALFAFVPWEYSKGEILELQVAGLESDVALNRGHWLLPMGPGKAWVGATHEPHFKDLGPTDSARGVLESSAIALLDRPFEVAEHFAGVRVNLPDKRPIAGRHPDHPHLGLVNALGAKGALWAPMLARQWVNHLTEGVAFDPEVAVERFWRADCGLAERARLT